MPGLSGIAVLGAARRRVKDIPVVFVTGHPDLLVRPGIPFEPSPIVFTKPLSYAELSERLSELLQSEVAANDARRKSDAGLAGERRECEDARALFRVRPDA